MRVLKIGILLLYVIANVNLFAQVQATAELDSAEIIIGDQLTLNLEILRGGWLNAKQKTLRSPSTGFISIAFS